MRKVNWHTGYFMLFMVIFAFVQAGYCQEELKEVSNHLGEITFFIGDIKMIKSGQAKVSEVTIGQKVYNRDKIISGKESRVEITLTDGSMIRVGELSEYQLFLQATKNEKDSKIVGEITLGKIWTNIRHILGGVQNVEVRSPTAVMAIRGTIARFDAATDKSEVYVYRGKVDVAAVQGDSLLKTSPFQPKQVMKPSEISGPKEVAGPKEVSLSAWTQIIAGQMTTVSKGGTFETKPFDAEADDSDWVKWNKERDKGLKQKK